MMKFCVSLEWRYFQAMNDISNHLNINQWECSFQLLCNRHKRRNGDSSESSSYLEMKIRQKGIFTYFNDSKTFNPPYSCGEEGSSSLLKLQKWSTCGGMRLSFRHCNLRVLSFDDPPGKKWKFEPFGDILDYCKFTSPTYTRHFLKLASTERGDARCQNLTKT